MTTKKRVLKASGILLAPLVVSGALLNTSGHKAFAEDQPQQVDSISQASTDNIQTKTVYYAGSTSDTFDGDNQDALVSNDLYQSTGGVATTLLVDQADSTSSLYSEKAISDTNASQALDDAEKQKAEDEEEARKAEEAKKAEEEAAAKRAEEARARQNQASGYTGYQVQADVPGVDGAADIQPNYSGNTYPVGECTWGAKALAPWAGNYWGNGGQWAASARAAGFQTGSQARVGAIAVWNDGGYGHVAVVVAVNGNQIQVKEANVNGNRYIANFRGWFDPRYVQGYVEYIYPPGS